MYRFGLSIAAAAGVLLWGGTAGAVVLCARPSSDGTFDASVRIREACRSTEARLDPAALGLQGPPGQNGATNVVVRQVVTTTPAGETGEATALCHPGERAVGGGSEMLTGDVRNFFFSGDDPVLSGSVPTAWHEDVLNDNAGAVTWRVYVICAAP